jgi:hypothetical protein
VRLGPGSSRDGACNLKTVHQFHDTVMLDEKSGGNFTNRWFGAFGKTLHGKQKLMLLRLDSVLSCRCLAEMKELPIWCLNSASPGTDLEKAGTTNLIP